jgi:hypothetical protein
MRSDIPISFYLNLFRISGFGFRIFASRTSLLVALFGSWFGGFVGPAAGQVFPPGNPLIDQSTNTSIHSTIARNSSIYARETNVFGSTAFFKPRENALEDLVFRLAPLMMFEVPPSESKVGNLQSAVHRSSQNMLWAFGTLEWSNGIVKADAARPAVYFVMDNVQIGGRAHARMTYLWCYVAEPGGQGGLGIQSVRLTLDLNGQPAIWEILADSSGAELIFVSQGLEVATERAFGKPLPGRRYAVERGLSEAPDIVVARVIDDGPVPIGPIVYLDGKGGDVSTLICRCMPAQAKELAGTDTYELLPLQSLTNSSLLAQARAGTGRRTAFWPGEKASDDRLEKCLRLPGTF